MYRFYSIKCTGLWSTWNESKLDVHTIHSILTHRQSHLSQDGHLQFFNSIIYGVLAQFLCTQEKKLHGNRHVDKDAD